MLGYACFHYLVGYKINVPTFFCFVFAPFRLRSAKLARLRQAGKRGVVSICQQQIKVEINTATCSFHLFVTGILIWVSLSLSLSVQENA